MVDDVAEKTRSAIDVARTGPTSDTDSSSRARAAGRPAPDPTTLLTSTATGVDSPEPDLVPAAIAPVVSTSRRALSLVLLLVIGLAAGIVVGTGILAAITWISDATLTSFA